ncbi:metal ABC transporter permease [Swingsia samuiensis]|uniref:Metal ABC transporter permease n=1 Tax=Swingsia samuiensis TaxID=1293412 RepID=A0A4Y6UK97_9PROT|nr:metal ABC transporter permease [Swingsia samuiensis]QDH16896.1 metal ABC transporter permease [Swingsia samuiensis]
MFEYEFMRHAFIGCALVSIISGPVGWFLSLRRQTFAAHALSHVGFSGAAAAVWMSISPFYGMIIFTLIAGLAMGVESKSDRRIPVQRDNAIGLVLAASLGVGTWFLHAANSSSSIATALLFGDILGIDTQTLFLLMMVMIICLLSLLFLARPLLFLSLSPQVALARGVPVNYASLGFMCITALACAACSEIAGMLLAFSLMIGPSATALRLNLAPLAGIIFSIILSLVLSWSGLILSWITDIPSSFWIGIGAVIFYCFAMAWNKIFNGSS